jgi:sec-independent protein translocase protein TatB
MLPEVGATELLVIAAIALIVVGPKDLPVMLRKLGQFVGRMRGMANEFRASFDEMARQSELDELRKEVEAMRSGRYVDPLRLAADEAADAQADQVFADIHAELTGRPTVEGGPEAVPTVEGPKPKRRAPAKKAATAAAPKKPRARKKPEASA